MPDNTELEAFEQETPPYVGWFVVEVDLQFSKEDPMYVNIRGPFQSETAAQRERKQQEEAYERAYDDVPADDPEAFDFKDWSVERLPIRDWQLEQLDREEEKRFGRRREVANIIGASLLADEGVGPLANDQ